MRRTVRASLTARRPTTQKTDRSTFLKPIRVQPDGPVPVCGMRQVVHASQGMDRWPADPFGRHPYMLMGVQPEAVRHQGHATYQGGTVQHEIIGQG